MMPWMRSFEVGDGTASAADGDAIMGFEVEP